MRLGLSYDQNQINILQKGETIDQNKYRHKNTKHSTIKATQKFAKGILYHTKYQLGFNPGMLVSFIIQKSNNAIQFCQQGKE